MAEKFENQGGSSNMDPPALLRWATSRFARRMISPDARKRRRVRAERARINAGAPHRVEYFHQVEDGYSHLAVQLLQPLLEHYDVELSCHLVGAVRDQNLPEPDLLLALSRYDAAQIAPHYGLRFPDGVGAPEDGSLETARRILAMVDSSRFPEVAVSVGEALWDGDADALNALAERLGSVDSSTAQVRIESGNQRRTELKHYSGAMFYYAGEWYWGADRFYHLENRLIEVGARKGTDRELICPRPAIESGPLKDDGSLTFEIYPSLRSPYTSVIFDAAVQLAKDAGVKMVMRPVLPMVMRGVPATRMKGTYIFSDSGREAVALGLDWGNFSDPIGDPVRNAYSLYPWACKQGRGTELLSSFMRAAFFDGVNTNNERGMRIVVENAGLVWDEAKAIMGNTDWEEEIEANRLAMYEFGSWGVPSFRLLDGDGKQVLALWGQDRLWLFAREIQRLLQMRRPARESLHREESSEKRESPPEQEA
ncbi:MAG: 2-hydroxychromene-2-carboxylate isomerase [bacterium]|nr:2-hydroxychromene-2-carboxylate isomerase [bacterium]